MFGAAHPQPSCRPEVWPLTVVRRRRSPWPHPRLSMLCPPFSNSSNNTTLCRLRDVVVLFLLFKLLNHHLAYVSPPVGVVMFWLEMHLHLHLCFMRSQRVPDRLRTWFGRFRVRFLLYSQVVSNTFRLNKWVTRKCKMLKCFSSSSLFTPAVTWICNWNKNRRTTTLFLLWWRLCFPRQSRGDLEYNPPPPPPTRDRRTEFHIFTEELKLYHSRLQTCVRVTARKSSHGLIRPSFMKQHLALRDS